MEIKGDKKVIIYTLTNCIYCNWLKGYLNREYIEYEEVKIDNGWNDMNGDQLEKIYKTETYPIVHILQGQKVIKAFISKTDLEEQENIRIYTEINELTKMIKNEI